MAQVDNKIHWEHIVSVDTLEKVDLYSSFFDIFREAYGEYFNKWWVTHNHDEAFVVKTDSSLVGFLKLKLENEEEDYSDIIPMLPPKSRLKISSIKVDRELAPRGLATFFMRIIVTAALRWDVDEVYGTVAVKSPTYSSVVKYLEKWNFTKVGKKFSHGIEEDVYAHPNKFEWVAILFEIMAD